MDRRQHRSSQPGGLTRRLTCVLIALLVVNLPGATSASADGPSADQCAPGDSPHFAGDFARLKLQLADWQGDPTTCEFDDPSGTGRLVQRTSTGLAYHSPAAGLAAFTNGIDHWALTADNIVYWNGPGADPPSDAQPAAANPCVERHTCTLPLQPQPTPIPAQAPTAATAETSYLTANGARTASQLHDELASAGYGGPWDAGSMLAAYARAIPRIAPYADDSTWSCLPDNPGCPRDPWWLESDARQESGPVTYPAVGTRFTTERRFGEAVDLLWQWPTGKDLLRNAERQSVVVISLSYDEPTAFATFLPERNSIAINQAVAAAPTWMVAALLAHELLHARDHADGVHERHDPAECFAEETNAFTTERSFLDWLTHTLRPDGLPALKDLSTKLTRDQSELAAQMYELRSTSSVAAFVQNLYVDTCLSG